MLAIGALLKCANDSREESRKTDPLAEESTLVVDTVLCSRPVLSYVGNAVLLGIFAN